MVIFKPETIMKRLFYMMLLPLLALTACGDKYELKSTGFSAPGAISGPAQVTIDLESTATATLSWEASDVDDGTWVLYDVVFDQADGNFLNPFWSVKSDGGTQNKLTLNQKAMNDIARAGGINPAKSGGFIWTVRAYRGGVAKYASESKNIGMTRPDVLDIPDKLYVFGTALANADIGAKMSLVSGGIFILRTTLAQAGNLWFCSSSDPNDPTATKYYYDATAGKLMQGEGTASVDTGNDEIDITVNFNNRSFMAEAPFEAPEELYIQGTAAEAGQKFRKDAADVFVLYTKFGTAGNIYFSSTRDANDDEANLYYVANGKLEPGNGTTTVAATAYTAERITVNTTARSMTIEPIGDIELIWVNANNAIDSSRPKFAYSSNGNFTLTFAIPANFDHIDAENKGGTAYTDARYFLRVNEDPTNPMPSDAEIKAIPAAERKIKRWGCKLTADYNMTISPYDRNHATAGVTHAAYWISVFETGMEDGSQVDTEEIIETPYYLYSPGNSEMPARWNANWFFKTAWAGTTKTATIYSDKNGKMSLHIE